MSKCVGCGIKLQDKFKDKLGYTKKLDNLYCERCFKTIHYNEERKIDNFNNDDILEKINKLNKSTIFISDFLSLNTEIIKIFKKIKNKKILVINKCDLIPNNIKLQHIEENIKNSFDLYDDVFFISAKLKYNLNKLIDFIEEEKNVIICGETSSGKSTLINKLISSNLTTSKYSNTTLDFIKLKYMDYVIYDSPGLVINSNKKNITNIKVITKVLKNDYNVIIDDIVINGSGNVTLFLDENVNVVSKKKKDEFQYKYSIKDKQDIELDNGFIFVKNGFSISSNKELGIRDSIIK